MNDSTLVVHLTALAGQLGGQAKTVLVWWVLLRFAVPVLWAGVAVFFIVRASNLAASIGRGQQLLTIIGNGSVFRASDANYAKAQAVLLETFKPAVK